MKYLVLLFASSALFAQSAKEQKPYVATESDKLAITELQWQTSSLDSAINKIESQYKDLPKMKEQLNEMIKNLAQKVQELSKKSGCQMIDPVTKTCPVK